MSYLETYRNVAAAVGELQGRFGIQPVWEACVLNTQLALAQMCGSEQLGEVYPRAWWAKVPNRSAHAWIEYEGLGSGVTVFSEGVTWPGRVYPNLTKEQLVDLGAENITLLLTYDLLKIMDGGCGDMRHSGDVLTEMMRHLVGKKRDQVVDRLRQRSMVLVREYALAMDDPDKVRQWHALTGEIVGS